MPKTHTNLNKTKENVAKRMVLELKEKDGDGVCAGIRRHLELNALEFSWCSYESPNVPSC